MRKPLAALIALIGVALVCSQAESATAASSPAAPPRYVEALFLLNHPGGLNRFVRSVSEPGSPDYRRYATVEQLVKRFGAPAKHRRATLSWLAQHGLRGRVGPTGTYVLARLPRGVASRLLPRAALATSSGERAVGRQVPAALRRQVAAIGLLSTRPGAFDPTASAAPAGLSATQGGELGSLMPHSGTSAGCAAGRAAGGTGLSSAFTPNQYLTAFGHAALQRRGFRGAGLSAALVEIDGFRRSDIAAFGKCFGVRIPPIRATAVGLKRLLAPGDETTLDLEVLSASAPGLKHIYVYEGRSSEAGIMKTAAAALGSKGHHPNAISISLGSCEPELNLELAARRALGNVFAIAAGAGISTLAAAGDQGSSACRVMTPSGATALPLLAVNDPASSPFVTAVGGTNISLNARNRIHSEVTWNDSPAFLGAGGGGVSLFSPQRPWWQHGPGMRRYGTGRLVPDISGLADVIPGYAIYCTAPECAEFEQPNLGWVAIGGTSAATPLMAGGVLLADQYAARHRQPALGFLNPLLYKLGDEKSRRSVFRDVTKGNNDLGRLTPAEAGGGHPLGCCSATPGYDLATGWGSLQVEGFAKAAVKAAR
jgi:subtilase family serine protease